MKLLKALSLLLLIFSVFTTCATAFSDDGYGSANGIIDDNTPDFSGYSTNSLTSVNNSCDGKTYWIKPNGSTAVMYKSTSGDVSTMSHNSANRCKWQLLYHSDGYVSFINCDSKTPNSISALTPLSDGSVTTSEYDFNDVTSDCKWSLITYSSASNLYYIRNYNGAYLYYASGSVKVTTVATSATVWKFYESGNTSTLFADAHGYADKINNSELVSYMNCYAYALMAYTRQEPALKKIGSTTDNLPILSYFSARLIMGEISGDPMIVDNVIDSACYKIEDGVVKLNNKATIKYYLAVLEAVDADLHELYGTYNNIESCNSDTIAASSNWRKVALVFKTHWTYDGSDVYNGFDFHWYVADQSGAWTHKPGSLNVESVDFSGVPITDLSDADKGDYDSFILYFLIRCDGVLKEVYDGMFTITDGNMEAGDILSQAKSGTGLVNTQSTFTGALDYSTKSIYRIVNYTSYNNYSFPLYIFNVSDGKYYEYLYSFNNGTVTTNYTGNSYSNVTLLLNSITVTSYISPTQFSDAYNVPQDVDFYEFVVSSSGTYEIYSEYVNSTDTIDFVGFLYNGSTLLTSADDIGSGNRNFKITYSLVPDTVYRIAITGYNSRQEGNYKVIIKKVS